MTLSLELFAQAPATTPDPVAQSKRIDAELKQLDQTPVGQEIAAMEKRFEDGMFQVSKAREEIRNGYSKPLRLTKWSFRSPPRGWLPNRLKLAGNDYAAYRAGEPAGSPAIKLVDWLVSLEGQSVVRESGYVPAN